ncbi:hypothetical protein NBRC116599_41580 [Aquicoccus sp. SU-CL01552]
MSQTLSQIRTPTGPNTLTTDTEYSAIMEATDWTDLENGAVVTAYFSMLSDELSGRRFNKAAQDPALQDQINRSQGSIEFKMCNVSAALRGLGLPIIEGYAPLQFPDGTRRGCSPLAGMQSGVGDRASSERAAPDG